MLTALRGTRICLLVFLCITLCSCSNISPARQPEPDPDPIVAPRLDSPLLSRAETINESSPGINHVELLDVGYDALLARIHLIRSARQSVTVQTMIWANDETGRYIIYELIQAARRGVEVRLLIDHVASDQNLEIASFLAGIHPNFHVKLFNPMVGFLGRLNAEPSLLDKAWAITFKFNRLNQRMHNKTFVVDGAVGITGGRNYQNAYYDQAGGMNYKDRDLLVVGPVVEEMRKSFEAYWTFERSIRLQDLDDVKKQMKRGAGRRWLTRDSFRLNGFFAGIEADVINLPLISERFVEPLSEVASAYFIADEPHKRDSFLLEEDHDSRITTELADIVSHAKQSVSIQTPYLVLSSRAIRLFKKIREQHPGIDIRISTNSLAATDSWYVYALSYKQKKTYLSSLKFKVFEFKPLPEDLPAFMPGYEQLEIRDLETGDSGRVAPGYELPAPEADRKIPVRIKQPYLSLHAKSLVVDDMVSFVGSYNLDPRSENINTECGLVISDGRFASLLKSSIETDMKPRNSWVIARKKRFVGVDEANAILVELSRLVPIADIWPFRYTASFELIDGKPAVEVDHADFYDNYQDVGSFPRAENNVIGKEIGARGTKAFLSFVRPLL